MIVARFSQDKHLSIDLFVGDAFDVRADALIFGRTEAITERIEQLAPAFEPVSSPPSLQYPLHPNRGLRRTQSNRLPWDFAYSIQYRPRVAAASSQHTQNLAFNIFQTVLLYLQQDVAARHVVIVPFSWRNPETLAYAIIGGLLHVYPRLVQTPTRYTIAALDNLDAFAKLLENPDDIKRALSLWNTNPPPASRVNRSFRRLLLQRAT